MAVTEIRPGVYRLGSHAHNFYIVTESGRATVIDAGCSKEWPVLEAGLQQIGLRPDDVAGMVITHGHADHIGCASMASKQGISVRIHEADLPRALREYEGTEAAQPHQLPVWKPVLWRNFMPMIRAGVMKQYAVPNIETFSDGDILDLPGSPVAIHTPGHTEGHAAFHLPGLDALFTGDALVTMGLVGGPDGPQAMPKAFDNDPATAAKSRGRLAVLNASVILPGHGEPWVGSPSDAVQAAN